MSGLIWKLVQNWSLVYRGDGFWLVWALLHKSSDGIHCMNLA
jgi:hypothetical protein